MEVAKVSSSSDTDEGEHTLGSRLLRCISSCCFLTMGVSTYARGCLAVPLRYWLFSASLTRSSGMISGQADFCEADREIRADSSVMIVSGLMLCESERTLL